VEIFSPCSVVLSLSMADNRTENRIWSDRIISRTDPTFRHRWDVYNDTICSFLHPDAVWVDLGCGNNALVETFGTRARYAVGADIVEPEHPTSAPFVPMQPDRLPFESEFADLITLRFVAEHLPDIPGSFAEIDRVLKPGGHVVVLTTNTWSPFIFLPRLLPFRLKNAILSRLYKVRDVDVMPTFHRLNSPTAMREATPSLDLVRLEFLQDANYVRRWIFLIFYAWHLATRPAPFRALRTNLLAVYRKPD